MRLFGRRKHRGVDRRLALGRWIGFNLLFCIEMVRYGMIMMYALEQEIQILAFYCRFSFVPIPGCYFASAFLPSSDALQRILIFRMFYIRNPAMLMILLWEVYVICFASGSVFPGAVLRQYKIMRW